MHTKVAFSYAPGKIILIGEHAVVYGAQAIAMPLEIGVRVAVSKIDSGLLGPMIRGVGPFFMGDTFLHQESAAPQVLLNALKYLADAFQDKTRDMAIVVDGSLPPGSGLGSSAALSVALIRALYRALGESLSEEKLYEHVVALETIFHGQPSGIDHTAVIKGQSIVFRRQANEVLVRILELRSSLDLVIGIVGPHDGTKNAVEELAHRKKRQEKAYDKIIQAQHDLAIEMEEALKTHKLSSVGELMNISQGYLNALSLSTPQVEQLCAIARERGALGAKLTGAGGGGAVIALCDGCERGVANAFKAAGFQSFITKVATTPRERRI